MFVIINSDKQFFARFSMMQSGRPKSYWASVQDDCVQTYLFMTEAAAMATINTFTPTELEEYAPEIVPIAEISLR